MAVRLSGAGVLVTRPAEQAEHLCALIESAGGRAVRLPALAIEPLEDGETQRQLLAEPWDLLIFISRNAVVHGGPLFPSGELPSAARIAAVGQATARALSEAGRAPDLVPAGRYDSETLLALPELADMRGQRVLIVRGDGGRALLGETLAQRGAEVRYAEVYRRVAPSADVGALVARWSHEVQIAMATSDEVLQNLVALVGPVGRAALVATPLIVVSERTGELARRLGFASVRVAARADDEAILEACGAVAAHLGEYRGEYRGESR